MDNFIDLEWDEDKQLELACIRSNLTSKTFFSVEGLNTHIKDAWLRGQNFVTWSGVNNDWKFMYKHTKDPMYKAIARNSIDLAYLVRYVSGWFKSLHNVVKATFGLVGLDYKDLEKKCLEDCLYTELCYDFIRDNKFLNAFHSVYDYKQKLVIPKLYNANDIISLSKNKRYKVNCDLSWLRV